MNFCLTSALHRRRPACTKHPAVQYESSRLRVDNMVVLVCGRRDKCRSTNRREKYTKKFFRRKKLYDIIRDKGKKAVREATWATRSVLYAHVMFATSSFDCQYGVIRSRGGTHE